MNTTERRMAGADNDAPDYVRARAPWRRRTRIAAALAISLPLLGGLDASGHSGGTNAAGCHTNHSTGVHHCHTPKSTSDRTTACRVVGR